MSEQAQPDPAVGEEERRLAGAENAPDEVLLAARDQARAALAEITDPQTIGADDGHEVHEAHVLTLFFECRLPGYPGWRWAATLTRVDEESPVTVLEAELLPGAGAVVAPEWVPWSVRLAQYRESQARQAVEEAAAAEAAAAELGDDDAAAEDDLLAGDILDNDFSDFDDEIDGVELDEGDASRTDPADADDADADDADADDEDADADDADADEDLADDSDDTELFDDDEDDSDDDEDEEDDSDDE
ncbi:DUF3027 domain-containing protein [Leucobacter sp. wl10]|uniref:DUF3027 domain-containing protein n=1 Tax=Leucobacter sp. wl10 TaxID=2304677 RepID=UPI000E5B3737|nr:DUF3027 domain-containing protein [Leucobacter sp. wl10]RGE16748.1 DUF3027 domain-containing protein [Leucobacter sp. wl10]